MYVITTGDLDYSIDIQSVTFSKGAMSVNIPISIIDDHDFENISEKFTISLSTDVHVPQLELLGDVVVIIQDNDSKSMQRWNMCT